MRLKDDEIKIIKETIKKFDKDAEIYLFGSRTDNKKRGGDIDLLIISNSIDFNSKLDIKALLYNELGEQKIDIIVKNEKKNPFVRSALKRVLIYERGGN